MIHGQRLIDPALAAGYGREGFWPGRLVTDYFEAAVAARPAHPAVVDNRFGSVSYAQLAHEVERLARGLSALGVSRGDCFIVQLPNWRVFTVFHLALTYLGALTINVPVTYRQHELRFIARVTSAAGIVIPDEFRGFDFAAMLDGLLSELPALRVAVVVGEHVPGRMRHYSEVVDCQPGQEHRAAFGNQKPAPNDVTAISFTSGTTGEPKGVMHTSNTFAAINISMARAYGLGSDDVIFMAAPLGHSIGLMHGVRLALFLGATLVLQDQWDAGIAISLIVREHATFTAGAPPLLHDLLSHPGLPAAGRLPSLRVFLCGGDFVPERLLRAAPASLPFTFVTGLWGMTEGIGTACRLRTPLERRGTTVGQPFPGTEVRIASPNDGASLPPGHEGELLIRGPQVFVGYFGRPDLNAAAFVADGFFRTGDLALVDEDGYVIITGRIKDLIVRGGVKISPAQVERVLSSDPRISAIAIVGAPDERLGERICAFVVPRAGAALTLQDLAATAEKRGLAKHNWPERLEVVEKLPFTASGKVQRHLLREWLVAPTRSAPER